MELRYLPRYVLYCLHWIDVYWHIWQVVMEKTKLERLPLKTRQHEIDLLYAGILDNPYNSVLLCNNPSLSLEF